MIQIQIIFLSIAFRMRTYTYAQSLLKDELKGYHFAVNAEGIKQFDDWVVANMQFYNVSAQNKREGIKDLPLCKISLFKISQQLRSITLVANSVKERQEIILQFRLNQELNVPRTVPADNSQYVFFQDLVNKLKNLYNGVVIKEGRSDFFNLIANLDWTSQRVNLQKQTSCLSGTNWSKIALWGIGSALIVGVAVVLMKKKQ